MTKNIIVASNINDANFIIKNPPKNNTILALTPNVFNHLKNINNITLIDPQTIDYDTIHEETISKTNIIDKLVEQKLNKMIFRESSQEYIKFQINVFASSFIHLLILLKSYENITIIISNKYKLIKNIDQNIIIIFNKMLDLKSFNYYFPIYNSYTNVSNLLIKIHNNILKYFFSNKNIIFSSGNDYGMEYINENLKRNFNLFTIIKLECLDKKYIYKIIKNLINLVFLKKNYYLFPTLDNHINYHDNIKIFTKEIYNKNNEFKLIHDLLFPILVNGVNYIENSYDYFSIFFEKNKIDYYFAHQIKMSNSLILADIAKSKKAKIFIISHGIHSFSHNTTTKNALISNANGMIISPFADFSLIQSKIAKKAFEMFNTNNIPLSSFPLMWGNKNISKNNSIFVKRKHKIILHASTFKSFNVRPWIYESAFEYIIGINKLISKFKYLKDTTLIIRVRPTPECSYDALHKLINKSENVIIKKGGSFLEDLKLSTLLISFSSTTIEEALYERIPVAIYANSSRFNHFDGITYNLNNKRSAVYNLNDKNLSFKLKEIIDNHYNKPLIDNEVDNFIWTNEEMDFKSFKQFEI